MNLKTVTSQSALNHWLQVLKHASPSTWSLGQASVGADRSEAVFEMSEPLAKRWQEVTGRKPAAEWVVGITVWSQLLKRYGVDQPMVSSSPLQLAKLTVETKQTLFFAIAEGMSTFREASEAVKSQLKTALSFQNYDRAALERLLQVNKVSLPIHHFGFSVAGVSTDTTSLGGSTLSLNYSDGRWILSYVAGALSVAQADRLLSHFGSLLAYALDQPDENLATAPILSEQEKTVQCIDWNPAELPKGEEHHLVDLLRKQARLWPDRPAIVGEDASYSYEVLNKAASQVAHQLHTQGVKPGVVVGLHAVASPQTLVVLLAILQAGGTYLPLDPEYPQARLAYMVAESRAQLVISEGGFEGSVPVVAMSSLTAVGPEFTDIVYHQEPAYIIFTSGSTGKPKGVPISHQQALHLLSSLQSVAAYPQGLSFALSASLSFDAAIKEIFLPMLTGGTLCVYPNLRDIPGFVSFLCKENVSVLHGSPLFWQAVIQAMDTLGTYPPLKFISSGGDALSESLAHRLRHTFSEGHFMNVYGPTETTINATAKVLDQWTTGAVSIGRALPGYRAYVVDAQGQLLPQGVAGELVLAGVGLSKGYLNQDQATEAAFQAGEGLGEDRIYRTGDRVCWSEAGELMFLGRLDKQVKIRGYRVEPDELRIALEADDAVAEVFVAVKEGSDGAPYLAAYVTLVQKEALPAVQQRISDQLPHYLQPGRWLVIDHMPRNIAGKVNVALLPDPEAVSNVDFVTPQTDTERVLAEFWQVLLGKNALGRDHDFFAEGGHSLLALRLLAKVVEHWSVDFTLVDVFRHSLLRDMASCIDDKEAMEVAEIVPLPAAADYPLSPAQRRLWIVEALEEGKVSYNVPASFQVLGDINPTALEKALNSVVTRHESLRTVFKEVEGEPRMEVKADPTEGYSFVYHDLSDQQDVQPRVQAALSQVGSEPFDLAAGPLVRLGLWKVADEDYRLSITFHHLISDGWSTERFSLELMEYYASWVAGKEPALAPLPFQYKDYAAWMADRNQEGSHTQALAYWKSQYQDGVPVLEIPKDYPRPAYRKFRGKSLNSQMRRPLTDRIERFAKQHQATPYMLLLAAFNTLLYRYTRQTDFTVGVLTAGRDVPGLEEQQGFFVNTLPIRSQVDGSASFEQHLSTVKGNLLAAFEHQQYPFEQIVSDLQVPRDASRSPIFDVLLGFQPKMPKADAGYEGLSVLPLPQESHTCKYDLSINIHENEEGYHLFMEYDADLFSEERMLRFMDYYHRMVEVLIEGPQANLWSVDFLPSEEKHRLVSDFNPDPVPFDSEETVHGLFQKVAKRHPEDPALLFENKKYSYRELDELSNRLAHFLQQEYQVEKGSPVAVWLQRSHWFSITYLAIIKIGGVFMPLDAKNPVGRLKTMFEEAKPALLFHDADLQPQSLKGMVPTCSFEGLEERLANYPTTDVEVVISSSDPLYIIYSSGSTGKPKGIVNNHLGQVNLVTAQQWFGAQRGVQYLQTASVGFDISATQTNVTLTGGGLLHVISEDVLLDLATFIARIKENGRVAGFMPTALFNLLIENAPEFVTTFISLVSGGEAQSPAMIRKLGAPQGRRNHFVNAYGPTETSGVCVFYDMAQLKEDFHAIPIGRPGANMRAYILDENRQLVPQGTLGQLCIAGVCVGPGYLNEALTTKKFLADPFYPDEKMYLSGDLARYDEGGNILFEGRMDFQVKLRGQRIELGEISSVLEHMPSIKEAVTVMLKNHLGADYLAAYYGADEAVSDDTIRAYLLEQMPEYMVPTVFVHLPELPRNNSHKVDRKRLPEPVLEFVDEFIEPGTEEEKVLAAVWTEVLHQDKIGVTDSFFSIGGDSIKAIQVAARLNQRGFQIKARQILQSPVLGDMARLLKRASRAIDQGPVSGSVALSPIQHWFLEEKSGSVNHFNQAVLMKPRVPLDTDRLQQVVDHLMVHHDGLRARYWEQGGAWRGELLENAPKIAVARHTLETAEALDSVVSTLQKSLSLADSRLLAIAHISLPDGDRVLWVLHHMVVDGISWRILLEDAETLYGQLEKGQALKLPAKSDSWLAWQTALEAFAQGGVLAQEKAYWEAAIQENHQPIIPSATGRIGDRQRHAFSLDEATTERLLRDAQRVLGTDVNDLLLAALTKAMHAAFGTETLQVALEGHGREEALAEQLDVSRTLGWFTAMYPVTLACDTGDLHEHLIHTKDRLHRVPNLGVGYGLLRYLQGDLALEASPQVAFNYLGQFDEGGATATFWEEAPEPVGHSIDENRRWPFALGLTAAVANGTMELEWVYAHEPTLIQNIEKLTEAFVQHLESLLTVACQGIESVLTASDMSYPHLDPADFSALMTESPLENLYRLSPLQEGLYFQSQHSEAGHDQYVRQLHYQLEAPLQPEKVQEAFNFLSARHEALRTAMVQVPGHPPLQAVVKGRAIPVRTVDLRGQSSEEQQQAIDAFRAEDLAHGFDLTLDPLTRVALFQKGERAFEVCWSFHHILIDGWCVGILTQEFFQVYQALVKGSTPNLLPTAPYGDYIGWLAQQDQQKALTFWREYLAGYDEVASVPFAKNRKAEGYRYGEVKFAFDETVTQQIVDLASAHSVTFSTVFQALWGLLLAKYNYRRDVVFGKVVSGRPAELPGVENMLGLFINTIPVRVTYEPKDTLGGFLQRLQAANADAESYQYSQLSEIQGNRPLFDQLLVFENYPVEENMDALAGEDIHIPEVELEEETDYDFNILIGPGADTKVKFTFNQLRYDHSAVSQVVSHFQHLVSQVLTREAATVGDLHYALPAELAQVVTTFNESKTEYPADSTLVAQFERQVAATPERIALVMGTQSLSYAELNRRANQVAHYLRETQAIQPNDLVGIHMGRSLEMMVALLGIIKSGAGYLPLDPDYPAERLLAMVSDAQIRCLISDQELSHDQAITWNQVKQAAVSCSSTNPEPTNTAGDTLYVMYTSGSTGKPKGVVVPHRAAVRLVQNTNYVDLSAEDRLLQTGSMSFDATTFEYWSLLTHGGCVHLLPQEQLLDAAQLKAYLHEQQITLMWMTAGWFNQLVDLDVAMFAPLKQLLVGGEKLSVAHINQVRAAHPHLQLINGYGPTENTTFSACYRIREAFDQNIPLGPPVANSQAYVLDLDGHPAAVGVAGELFLAGDGLAKGYLNRPELTAERFVALPQVQQERAYASGDLAHWLPDGTLEYVGRVDDQVKIRGYRIEPGEIAEVMQTHPEVDGAVVTVLTDEQLGKYLVGYYTRKEGAAVEDLKLFLADRLPEYMVPSQLIGMEVFPLNPNGKVDREALPMPDVTSLQRQYLAPRDELETQLAGLWASILGLNQVGAMDHFFELGGHSLKVVLLQSKVMQAFGIQLELKEIFQHPVLEDQAKEIKRKQWMMGQPTETATPDTSNVIEI